MKFSVKVKIMARLEADNAYPCNYYQTPFVFWIPRKVHKIAEVSRGGCSSYYEERKYIALVNLLVHTLLLSPTPTT